MVLKARYFAALAEIGVLWAQLSFSGSHEEPGVACYFEIFGSRCVIAEDRHTVYLSNMQAVIDVLAGLCTARRSSETYFRNAVSALRLGAGLPKWCVYYGFGEIPERADLEREHRKRVLATHPDRKGNHDAMRELNDYHAEARAYYETL